MAVNSKQLKFLYTCNFAYYDHVLCISALLRLYYFSLIYSCQYSSQLMYFKQCLFHFTRKVALQHGGEQVAEGLDSEEQEMHRQGFGPPPAPVSSRILPILKLCKPLSITHFAFYAKV
jgi:hypothetical protein